MVFIVSKGIYYFRSKKYKSHITNLKQLNIYAMFPHSTSQYPEIINKNVIKLYKKKKVIL